MNNRIHNALRAGFRLLPRSFFYDSSEIPSHEEWERLEDATRRVFIVIKMRWSILAVLALYGMYAVIFYSYFSSFEPSRTQKIVPIAAFGIAATYNAWYHYSYRIFARLRHLNLMQILVDLSFVLALIHFSGGVTSWFWAMCFVLILEGAFLGEEDYDGLVIAGIASLAYGALLTSEFYAILPHENMPFEDNHLHHHFGYVMLKWGWVTIAYMIVGSIGSYMMRIINTQNRQMQEITVTDALSQLYNRRYFFIRFNSEIQRAKRYNRPLSLLMIDIDHFKRVNDTRGHQAGDTVIAHVAQIMKNTFRRSDQPPAYDIDIPCRYGGEEFAVILPEADSLEQMEEMSASPQNGHEEHKGPYGAAERFRTSLESSDIMGLRVTASIGVAVYPDHGDNVESLIRVADEALLRAKSLGRNRTVIGNLEKGQHADGGLLKSILSLFR